MTYRGGQAAGAHSEFPEPGELVKHLTFRCLPHSCKWSIRGVGFTVGVSPKRIQPPTERTTRAVDALTAVLADRPRDARRRRHWSIATLAERARLSRPMVVAMEHAQRASLDTWVALAQALGLELEMELVDPRRRGASTACREDPVHAAMGELEGAHLQRLGFSVAIDEPYQHFQFAGEGVADMDLDAAIAGFRDETARDDVDDVKDRVLQSGEQGT